METGKYRERSGPSCLRSQESRKMASCECGGNEASQTDWGKRLEPGGSRRPRNPGGGRSARESTKPALALDIEKERTRRSMNGKVSLWEVPSKADIIGM